MECAALAPVELEEDHLNYAADAATRGRPDAAEASACPLEDIAELLLPVLQASGFDGPDVAALDLAAAVVGGGPAFAADRAARARPLPSPASASTTAAPCPSRTGFSSPSRTGWSSPRARRRIAQRQRTPHDRPQRRRPRRLAQGAADAGQGAAPGAGA